MAFCVLTFCTYFSVSKKINMKYFYICLVYLDAFLICTVIPVDKFKAAFVDVISVLALVSVIGFCLRHVYPQLAYVLPKLTNISGLRYGNMLLTMIPYNVSYVTFRNYGIFREPGVYQFFLNLTLIFLMERPKAGKSWQLYAVLLALAFTFSTAGYIVCIGIILLYFFLDRVEIRASTLVPVLAGVVVVGYLFGKGIIHVDSNLFSKLLSSNASTNSRFGSILVDLYIALMKPLFGSGFSYVEGYFAYIAWDKFGLLYMHNTNTIMKMLAVFGFVMPSLFLIGNALFCRKFLRGNGWTLFFLLFVALLSSSDLIFNTTIYIFMFYGFFDVEHREIADANSSD
jgi:hypothetical protein